jgi:large subunit ribosomal protein L19
VEVTMKGRVRRARLNFLRELEGKAARIKGEKGPDADTGQKKVKPAAATPAPETPPAAAVSQ